MNLVLHWPQITVIALTAIALFLHAAMNGKPLIGNFNFALRLCCAAFELWILWCGGFFE